MTRRRKPQLRIIGGKVSYRLDPDSDQFWLATVDGGRGGGEVYEPRQLVAEAGSWVMIKRQLPPLEGSLDEKLTCGRVFFAERMSNADFEGFSPDGKYRVWCRSPFGDCILWPYEYCVVEPEIILAAWQAGEMTFHPLNVSSAQFNDIVFFARSRGIPLADAVVMALGTITGNVGWFDPRQDIADEIFMLSHMGGPLTEVNHERRRRAHERRTSADSVSD